MKRVSGKGIDALTIVHKLVGVAWVAGAIGVLVVAVPLLGAADTNAVSAWTRIGVFQDIASASSVATLLLGLVYGLWTNWGFFKYRGVVAKWALFLAATGFAGPGISAARAGSASTVVILTVAEMVVLVAAGGVGVFLERSRHSGRLNGF